MVAEFHLEHIRLCALDKCDRTFLVIDANGLAVAFGATSFGGYNHAYCCKSHASTARKRRQRARRASLPLPYVIVAKTCPFDGRHFPIDLFARRRGRPQKYDCKQCRKLASEQRRVERMMKAEGHV